MLGYAHRGQPIMILRSIKICNNCNVCIFFLRIYCFGINFIFVTVFVLAEMVHFFTRNEQKTEKKKKQGREGHHMQRTKQERKNKTPKHSKDTEAENKFTFLKEKVEKVKK